MNRVKCTITFFYDPETYIYEWENTRPSDEEIFKRCKEYMLLDVSALDDPIHLDIIHAEFVEDNDATSTNA